MAITIAIDGPAASGKGTVARAVAKALGYSYVDTGAMYRAVALAASQRGVSWEDEARLAAIAAGLVFRFGWDGERLTLMVDGADVSSEIRQDHLGTGASRVSRHPAVRAALLEAQRALGREGGVVMDGRDIGTVVLPDAQLKVYLDASPEERARRRLAEIIARGEAAELSEVREAMRQRDALDAGREAAPLRPADDAVIVDSTGMRPAEVVARILDLAAARG